VRRDARGRWRAAPLLQDEAYGSWDGISVLRLEPRADRVRLVAMPWQGGECGYAHFLDVTFDLDLRHVRVVQLGEALPDARRAPTRDGYLQVLRDAAGREVGLVDQPAAQPPLVRLADDDA